MSTWRFPRFESAVQPRHPRALWAGACCLAMLLAGCAGPPIGADLAGPRGAYEQVERSALTSGELSANTLSLLYRRNLDQRARRDPAGALRALYAEAAETRQRDLLFVLAELSFLAGEQERQRHHGRSDPLARDLHLGAAVYAYLFLFGEADGPRPDGYDRRFRTACDLYNYGLGMALATPAQQGPVVELAPGERALPVGRIRLQFDATHFPWPVADFEQFLAADQFHVRGLSVRNRDAGLGAPLIAVTPPDRELYVRHSAPATVFLRVTGGLRELEDGSASGRLEMYSAYGEDAVEVGDTRVPLEVDLTTAQAHMLNQSLAWEAGRLQFFASAKAARSQIIISEPYQPGRVPVVLVHGTFSSPVWWAEMVNTLNADPVLRERFQIWTFIYSSSRPIEISANELRAELEEAVRRFDPAGTDEALRHMVVIGHSQGGLLAKLTATATGDRLWRVFSDKSPDELELTPKQRALIRDTLYYEPLPCVRRVVFLATPHRGSYRAAPFARNFARRFITLPEGIITATRELIRPTEGVELPAIYRGRAPTSLDEMSPDNPVLLALADIPVADGITAHSIIPVLGTGDYRTGRDGVVSYTSAHVDWAASEFIVRGGHSCQALPPTIEEVRRILHEHLAQLPATARHATAF